MQKTYTYTYTKEELEKLIKEKEDAILREKRESFFQEGGFWEFCKWWNSDFFTESKYTLKQLCDILQKLTERKPLNVDGKEQVVEKAIISVMPRFGKSYTTSLLCVWTLAKDINNTIMRNCCNDNLAEHHSLTVREIISSEKFKEMFPKVRLHKLKKEISGWKIEGSQQVNYLCAGVGGRSIGKGVNSLLIADDLVKDNIEASSANRLQTIHEWYYSVHRERKDRIKERAIEIVIGTRWCDDDIIGRLLQTEGGEWAKFIFPALDENEMSMCEAVETTKELHKKKKELYNAGLGHVWEAQYMCDPVVKDGVLIQRSDLKRFSLMKLEGIPIDAKVGFIDFADKGIDYYSFPVGFVSGRDVYIVDWVFSQAPIEKTKPKTISKVEQYRLDKIRVESNAGGRVFALELQPLLEPLGTTTDWKQSTVNKNIRIDVRSEYIKRHFHFLRDEEQSNEYRNAFKQITRYNKKLTKQADDAIDSLAGLVDLVQGSRIKISTF